MEKFEMSGFNPEMYRNSTVDIVHPASIARTAQGRKSQEIDAISQAKLVLERIDILRKAGIQLREITDKLDFIPPVDSSKPIVVGGAFVGQCIEDYMQSAAKQGYHLRVDPLISLRVY